MIYEQIEKEYWGTFYINQGTDKINGYPVIKISDTYSRPATVEDFESFLKQSFIKYLQSQIEMLPEGGSKADLFSSDPTRMFRADIREEYRNEVIAKLQAQIKEIEG